MTNSNDNIPFTRRTALTSVLWSALENGSMTVISFLSLIIFAKLLTPRDFGTYSVAISVIEIVGILTNMLFHDALIQRADATDAHFNSAFSVSIVVSAIVCAAMWFGFPLLSPLFGDVRLGEVGGVLALGFLISGPVSIVMARQRKDFGFRQLAVRTLTGRIGGAALGMAAAFAGYGLWSLVIQYLAMTILGAATLVFLSTSRLRLTTDLRPAAELLRFSLGSVSSLFVNFATKRVFVFFCGFFLGLESAGYLNLAFRLIDTLWSVTATAILQVALPSMSRLQFDRERLVKSYMISVSLACSLLYPLFIGVGLLAPEIIVLFFGPKWLPSSGLMLLLSLLVVTQAARIFVQPLLSATGRLWDLNLLNWSGLGYMLLAIAITRLPSPYVAVAVWAGCEAIYFAASAFVLQRMGISLIEQIRRMIPPLAACAVMAAVIFGARALFPLGAGAAARMAALTVTGALAFSASLWMMDRKLLRTALDMFRPAAG